MKYSQAKVFTQFEEQQSRMKTLRFRLLAQGRTAEYIKERGILEKDLLRAEAYPLVKNAADDFYRAYISDKLSELELNFEPLAEAYEAFAAARRNRTEDLQDKQSALNQTLEDYRNLIYALLEGTVDRFGQPLDKKEASKNRKNFDAIFKADFINKTLPEFVQQSYEGENKKGYLNAISLFHRFTGYFINYFDTRKNVFTAENIETSITHRLIHKNFPIYLQNIQTYHAAKTYIHEGLRELEAALREQTLLPEERSLDDYFIPSGYNMVCEQHGIDIYNSILGGFFKNEYEKVKGFNELVNLHNQAERKREKDNDVPARRLAKASRLNKQILSYSESTSYLIEQIEDDDDLYNRLAAFISFMQGDDTESDVSSPLSKYDQLFTRFKEANPNKLMIDAANVNKLSHSFCGRWDALQTGLLLMHEDDPQYKNDSRFERFSEAIDLNKDLASKRVPIYFSLSELDSAYERLTSDDAREEFEQHEMAEVFREKDQLFSKLFTEKAAAVLGMKKDNTRLMGNEDAVVKIKFLLDESLNRYHLWNLLECDAIDLRDNDFYAYLDETMEDLSQIIRLYNLTRNYLSKKPSAKEKYRLNFNFPTLADGWSESKVADNAATLFRHDGLYYLGILSKRSVYQDLLDAQSSAVSADAWQRMEYYFFPDAAKMIPKCSFVNEVKNYFAEQGSEGSYRLENKNFENGFEIPGAVYRMQYEDLYEGKKKYQIDYFRKSGDETGYRKALAQWIDFCKAFLKSYAGTAMFDYSELKASESYDNLNDFYADVNRQNYRVFWSSIPKQKIDELVEDGRMYLFQIYNKDFSPKSTGKPNLHTLYWRALFSPENDKLNRIKLGGEAELFKRPAQIKTPKRHKKGSILLNRSTTDGKVIDEKLYDELYLYLNKKLGEQSLSSEAQTLLDSGKLGYREAKFEIVKDRRYTEDRFFFHVPLMFNWSVAGSPRLNDLTQSYIASRDDLHIIGIDRGERHLLYYSVINLKGEVVEQGSLNSLMHRNMDGSEREVHYHALLNQREKSRAEARVAWKNIDQIKDLKEGYLSHVIHRLSKLVVEYNAIICLENLNVGFKRGRFKVEKQVYQKFETALMDKLSALSFKEIPFSEPASVLRPLQLSTEAKDYRDGQTQNGIIFYVPAAYTSVVDPKTGFMNLFSFKRIKRKERKGFLEHLQDFRYDEEKDMFAFDFDYNDFGKYCRLQNLPEKAWTAYTNGERISFNPRERKYFKINLTQRLKDALLQAGIDCKANELWKRILDMPEGPGKYNLLSEIFQVFRYSLQLRNSDSEQDYILSPVLNAEGSFFDSREAKPGEPENADANGACHIARKGLMLVNRIKGRDPNAKRSRRLDLAISNADWYSELIL